MIQNILPVEYPPITTYTKIAHPLTFLWAHKESFIHWFCDHYLQLTIRPGERDIWANFYDNDFYDSPGGNSIEPYNFCPFCKFQKIDRLVFKNDTSDFSNFIEHQINNGYYIYAPLNHYHLSCSGSYGKWDNVHSTFIYGYDSEASKIYVSDFFEHGKYAFKTVSYSEINKSDANIPYESLKLDWYFWITLFKYSSCEYKFNIDLLKISMEDYINCKDSLSAYKYPFFFAKLKTYFGLDYYTVLEEHCRTSENIDQRAFHLLYDHKLAMRIRLNYLRDNHLISEKYFNDLYANNESLIEKALVLRNMMLKFKISNNKDLLASVSKNILSLRESDRVLQINILDSIL